MADLKTETLDDVEILAVGTWEAISGTLAATAEFLDNLVTSFQELRTKEDYNYDPPVQLGHDEHQRLVQADGYPAAGWVHGLKRVGEKVLATLEEVPTKVADLIRAGAYKYVSSTIDVEYTIDGTTYPVVLRNIALQGADTPAVKSISDILGLYATSQFRHLRVEGLRPITVHYCTEGEPLDTKLDQIRKAYRTATTPPSELFDYSYVLETYADHIIVNETDKLFKVPYSIDADNNVAFDFTAKVEVKVQYVEVLPEQSAESEWTSEYQNTLSDSSFADIEPGGEKDAEGKTTPRGLRHLPYKDADGTIDVPHLRTAILSLSQTDLSIVDKAVVAVLRKAAEEVDVGEEAAKILEEVDKLTMTDEKEKELRALLKLGEKDDIPEAVVIVLKARDDALLTVASQHAAELIAQAITDGKIAPALKEWALAYALRDEQGFMTFTQAAPKVVELGERGGPGGDATVVELTELEKKTAIKLGVSEEKYLAEKVKASEAAKQEGSS